MTPFDPANFLHSLATFMAAAVAGGAINYASGSPRALWIFQAPEKTGGAAVDAADPYSVLSIYGGPPMIWDPQAAVSVQCKTVGTGKAATATRAQKLFDTLCDADGIPWQMKRINGLLLDGTPDAHYTLVGVEFLGRPGLIGVDERNRQEVVFNFDVGFFKELS